MVITSIWNDILNGTQLKIFQILRYFDVKLVQELTSFWSDLCGPYDWLETLEAIDDWISYNTLLNQKIPYNSFAFPQSCVSFQEDPHV
jgi:hypothetical protein